MQDPPLWFWLSPLWTEEKAKGSDSCRHSAICSAVVAPAWLAILAVGRRCASPVCCACLAHLGSRAFAVSSSAAPACALPQWCPVGLFVCVHDTARPLEATGV
jgi:hypothetical protein